MMTKTDAKINSAMCAVKRLLERNPVLRKLNYAVTFHDLALVTVTTKHDLTLAIAVFHPTCINVQIATKTNIHTLDPDFRTPSDAVNALVAIAQALDVVRD